MNNLNSEIVNQKKQFIFDVEASTKHAFPKENILFYIYIKNVSGVNIENFRIKIEKDEDFFFEKDIPEEDLLFTLKNNKTELFNMTGYCKRTGKFHIHFIAYGEGTQIAHDIVTINCNRIYNSDKLLHRIHIYNFNPYENKYSLEAEDYSEDVTQTFKRQKLPYMAGEQPFPPERIEEHNNKESQSFIDQLYGKKQKGLKNIDEHSYQYISRENFTEDSIENYTGENLLDLINQINKNSEYFKATFLRSGTNHLLNDFTQYRPNGLIYRLGLLSSEIYHKLGVIPTFSYMNDIIFRWAPSPSGQHLFLMGENSDYNSDFDLINLYPKPKAMKWGENVWSGDGWFVYRIVTDEYKATNEFKNLLEEDKIILEEKMEFFENKTEAQDFIRENEEIDNRIRNQIQDDLVKYTYELRESLYSSGIFFVNIPLGKIPTNFYLTSSEELYKIINRAKPFGMKPILNYIIEEEFDATIEQSFVPNYNKSFIFNMETPDIKYNICEKSLVKKELNCNGEEISYLSEEPVRCVHYLDPFEITSEIDTKTSFKICEVYEQEMKESSENFASRTEQMLVTLEDIKEILYNNNYDNISFYLSPPMYTPLHLSHEAYTQGEVRKIIKDDLNNYKVQYINEENKELTSRSFDSIKIKVNKEDLTTICIVDTLNRLHKMSSEYKKEDNSFFFYHSYENSEGKSYIKKSGYQNIEYIVAAVLEYNNRAILIFLVEDKDKKIHYFNHVIVQDIKEIKTFKNNIESNSTISTLSSLSLNEIVFETPFCYSYENYNPTLIKGEEKWNNIYRINTSSKKYSFIENNSKEDLSVEDLRLIYDNINIPETSIIKQIKLTVDAETRKENKSITIEKAIGKNYTINDVEGDLLFVHPKKIECYPQYNESNSYYESKLNSAILKDQPTLIKVYEDAIDENTIFNEELNLNINKLSPFSDYITVSKPYWVEISDYVNETQYDLNDTKGISLIIEGYNDGNETTLFAQTSSETNNSSTVSERIPQGYFYKKIHLLYPNQFLLDILRIRFRFKDLNHNIKIFDTNIELQFKNKQESDYLYDKVTDISLKGKEIIYIYEHNNVMKLLDDPEKTVLDVLDQYIYPEQLNNGFEINIKFPELTSGDFYHISSIKLEIIYQDTDIEMMINKNKYHYVPYSKNPLTIEGISSNAYVSGLFYNDVATISQIESDISYKNKGLFLKDAVFQSFESRADNITSIEIFPQGFVGSPDETLKIGLYTNNGNSPGKLIKEVFANGWVKNNEELKDLDSIKYNLNIDNLKINEKYWFKIQVANPKENSYYILKDFEKSLPRHKMLLRENNNYINSFNTLTFNIYSQNLSRSFRDVPAVQTYFNNPYILIGLHKGQGEIRNLSITKWDSDITEEENMKEYFDSGIQQTNNIIISDSQGNKVSQANFIKDKWDDYNGE